MGRELKRVPMDFDWPLHKLWDGYVNPHSAQCEKCEGTGADKSLRFLQKWVGLLCLAADESRYSEEDIRKLRQQGRIYPHRYLQAEGMRIQSKSDLGPGLIELVNALAGGKGSPFGYSCEDTYQIRKKILQAAGLAENWGVCLDCGGYGMPPDVIKDYEAWDPEDPPKGEGYQLWENTSEGSPVSPVFATLDELCAWCEENATTFGSAKATKEQWRTMLDDGFVFHQEGSWLFV